jgi:hypothetical protein
MVKQKKRGKKLSPFFVWVEGDEYGIAVIAYNTQQAKSLGCKYLRAEYDLDMYELPFKDCNCEINKIGDISGLDFGIFDDIVEGVRRKLYTFGEDGECDDCGYNTYIKSYTSSAGKNLALCEMCIKKRKGGDNADSSHA